MESTLRFALINAKKLSKNMHIDHTINESTLADLFACGF